MLWDGGEWWVYIDGIGSMGMWGRRWGGGNWLYIVGLGYGVD